MGWREAAERATSDTAADRRWRAESTRTLRSRPAQQSVPRPPALAAADRAQRRSDCPTPCVALGPTETTEARRRSREPRADEQFADAVGAALQEQYYEYIATLTTLRLHEEHASRSRLTREQRAEALMHMTRVSGQKDPTKRTHATWTRTNQNNCTSMSTHCISVLYSPSKQCIVNLYGASKHSI